MKKTIVYTIGHSTRTIKYFIDMLNAFGVQIVVDVRTIPRSRHNPQFNEENLPPSLLEAGIKYKHIKGLGGLRHAEKDSPNMAWRNSSFRGFADYMQTEDFASNLDKLIAIAKKKKAAIMCAESVPWRCHRSLIADALLTRGIEVCHIASKKTCKEHTLTPWIKVRGKKITYPLTGNSK